MAPYEAGRLARALCSDTCGCEFPFSDRALTDPRDGCSVDAAPTYFNHLRRIPCKDVYVSRFLPSLPRKIFSQFMRQHVLRAVERDRAGDGRWVICIVHTLSPTPSTRDISQPKLRTTPGPRTRPSRRHRQTPRAASRPAGNSVRPTAPFFWAASSWKTSSRGAGCCSTPSNLLVLV